MIAAQTNLPLVSNEPEVDYSIPKLVVVLLFGSAIAAGLGYALAFGGLLRIALFGAGLLIFFSLQSLFVKDLGRIALFLFIEISALAGTMFYFKAAEPLELFGIGIVVFYLLVFWASRNGRRESEMSLKVNFFRVARTVISGSMIGLLVFEGALLSVRIHPGNQEWISRRSFENNISRPLAGIVRIFMPGVDANMEFGDFLGIFALKNASRMTVGDVGFDDLPEETREQYLRTVTDELEKAIEDFAKVDLNPNASVSDNLYDIVRSRFDGFLKTLPSLNFAGIVVAVILILMQSFVWLFNWILSAIALMFYGILIFFGFARVSLENRSRETVILR